MSTQEYDDIWETHLHELLDALEPQIRDCNSIDELQDYMLNLEETDTNFHRYGLVQQIRKKLQLQLGAHLDEIIEKEENVGDSTFVSKLSHQISSSEQYTNVANEILSSIKTASSQLCSHLERSLEYESYDSSYFQNHSRFQRSSRSIGEESNDSSLDRVDFMFMSPDRYKTLAKDIHPSRPLSMRIEALSIIQQAPQTDLLASDVWHLIKQGLLSALNDENEEIVSLAMKFFSRIFAAGTSHVTREIFLMFVQHLCDYFNDTTSHMLPIHSGIDMGDRRNILLLKKFRLFNQVQQYMPVCWLRYPEKHIEEMIEATIMLLNIIPESVLSDKDNALMTPLHFLSLLDPQATWFQHWTHGVYGRTEILNQIAGDTNMLKKVIQSCLTFLQSVEQCGGQLKKELHPDLIYDNELILLDEHDIEYAFFVHSTAFIGRLLTFRSAQKLFPFYIHAKTSMSVSEMVLMLVQIMNNSQVEVSKVSVHRLLFHPMFIVSDKLRNLASSSAASSQCLCNDEVINEMMYVFNQFLENSVDSASEHRLSLVCGILVDLFNSRAGRHQILYGQNGKAWEMVDGAAVYTATKLFLLLLSSSSTVSASTLIGLARLMKSILSTHDGQRLLQTFNIADAISKYLAAVSQGNKQSAKEVTTKQDMEVQYKLLDCLLAFCKTPLGFLQVFMTGSLQQAIKFMHVSHALKPALEKVMKYGFGALMNQVSQSEPGVLAIMKTG